jgi:glyoxylase-like metal-dependent hydrolase (beta-lactamase superfamily II)
MKRIVVTAAALLALSVATVLAQRPPPAEGEDHSQVLASGLYSINWGTMGLNVGMSSGDDGILLVDAQDEPAVPRLQAEIAKRSDKAVRVVINSHWHFDHVGANELYRRQGATIIAQENTRLRLMTEQVNPLGGKQRAFPASRMRSPSTSTATISTSFMSPAATPTATSSCGCGRPTCCSPPICSTMAITHGSTCAAAAWTG